MFYVHIYTVCGCRRESCDMDWSIVICYTYIIYCVWMEERIMRHRLAHSNTLYVHIHCLERQVHNLHRLGINMTRRSNKYPKHEHCSWLPSLSDGYYTSAVASTYTWLIFLSPSPSTSLWKYNCLPVDVNECERQNGGCGYQCSNTVGSYHCSCPVGYILAEDGLAEDGLVCEGII